LCNSASDEKSKEILFNIFHEQFYLDSLYGNWFEEYSQDTRERQKLVEKIIENKNPSGVYILFASLIQQELIHNVFTTNFDDFVNESLITYFNIKSRVYSHNEIAKYISISARKPNIIKLHGDYLFENILNTNEETNELYPYMKVKLKEALDYLDIVVIGYGGSDCSIMNAFEQIKKERPFGLYWCSSDESRLHWRTINLINNTSNSFFIHVGDFETFVTKLWSTTEKPSINLIKTAEDKQNELDNYLRSFKIEVEGKKQITKEEKDTFDKYLKSSEYFKLAYDEKEPIKKIELYTKSIELDSNKSASFNNRGIIFSDLTRYDKAIEDFSRAIELDPKNSSVYSNRGAIFYKLKDYAKSVEDCNKAIELDRNRMPAYITKGIALVAGKHYDEAIENCNEAIRQNPNYELAYNNRGSVFNKLMKYEKAIEDYNRAIELNSKFSLAYRNRANTYYELNQPKRAMDDANKALDLSPEDSSYYDYRGILFYKLKQYNKAIRDFEKAIDKEKNYIAPYLNLSELNITLGKYILSLNYLKKAKTLLRERDDIIIFTFLQLLTHKCLEKNVNKIGDKLKELLKENIEVNWSFKELEKWLKTNNMKVQDKKYIFNWINKIKLHISL
jgi:tetratricopeptide (TPR) repeat protein